MTLHAPASPTPAGRLAAAAAVLAGLLAAGAAPAQPAGPPAEAGPADQRPVSGRFEAGFVYGLAAFTAGHADAAWYDGSPTAGGLDLGTSPTLGLGLAWAARPGLRLGLRATRQATRLETDGTGGRLRTDLDLLHLHATAEAALGGGKLRPLVALAAGGTRAAGDGAGGLALLVRPRGGGAPAGGPAGRAAPVGAGPAAVGQRHPGAPGGAGRRGRVELLMPCHPPDARPRRRGTRR